ncbi:MAG: MBL fold metallo-hydrolase [Myxococcota bacterium]
MPAPSFELWSIEGNRQRLDGGAMFGNAPRALWQRWTTPDEEHRIPLACRCMLVRDGQRTILLEAGIGAFFEPKLRERFGVVEPEHRLLSNLQTAGVRAEDVDIVVLSHLHFDHAGGLLTAYEEGTEPQLAFPNAAYVLSEDAWQRAEAPHARDRASFIPALLPLLKTRRVERVTGERSTLLGEGYRFHYSDGHTPGLLLTEIEGPGGPIVFAGDLVPGVPWVHAPITMGYDRFPERLIDEKSALLEDLAGRGGALFFTHDPEVAVARIAKEKGRFKADRVLKAPIHLHLRGS